MSGTNWNEVANALIGECPSPAFRAQAVAILDKVQHLGPLLSADRTPGDEFRRVYRFLTYNEPERVMAVVEDRLATFRRGGSKPLAKYNAWNYTVGVFDTWLSRARVFYMATGLVEGALRARLDARMTDHYGHEWTQVNEAIPSPIRPLVDRTGADERLGAVRRLVDECRVGHAEDSTRAIEALRELVAAGPLPPLTGAELVGELDFGKLRTFFQAKKLWGKGPKLETLFSDPETGRPPLRTTVDDTLGVIHGVRNAVAHYVQPLPSGEVAATGAERHAPPSFTKGLYALARLAKWMGVDLQHFYAAVDTRNSTELSLLIEDKALYNRAAGAPVACAGPECTIREPLDVLLTAAPTRGEDLVAGAGKYACAYHRVHLRTKLHRPNGE